MHSTVVWCTEAHCTSQHSPAFSKFAYDRDCLPEVTLCGGQDVKIQFLTNPLCAAMTIKKKIQTKFRLPILNWTPLKPQQVKGTVFSELDDEKLYSVSHKLFSSSAFIRWMMERKKSISHKMFFSSTFIRWMMKNFIL